MNDRFRAVWTIKRRTDSCTATGVGAMQRLHIWGKVSTGTKEPPIRRNTSSIFFSLSLFTEKRWQVIFNFATFESEQTVFQERQDLCITLPLIRCQSRCYSPPPPGKCHPLLPQCTAMAAAKYLGLCSEISSFFFSGWVRRSHGPVSRTACEWTCEYSQDHSQVHVQETLQDDLMKSCTCCREKRTCSGTWSKCKSASVIGWWPWKACISVCFYFTYTWN